MLEKAAMTGSYWNQYADYGVLPGPGLEGTS